MLRDAYRLISSVLFFCSFCQHALRMPLFTGNINGHRIQYQVKHFFGKRRFGWVYVDCFWHGVGLKHEITEKYRWYTIVRQMFYAFHRPCTGMDRKEKLLMAFGKHLATLRRAQGLSIHQLANAAGLEYSQVQRIEKGKVNLAFTTLMALVQGLNTTPAELLKGYHLPD